MPQEQKQKKISTAPSQGFLQRLFGTSEMTPEMIEGINIARQEMPDLAPVESYGPLSRLFMGGANAYTSPGKKIYLNPKTLQGHNPQEVADTLTHEQEHVKQIGDNSVIGEILKNSVFGQGMNMPEPYHRNPREIEAFKAEEERRRKMGRGGTTAVPSFLTGEFYTPRDIRLREPQPSIEERQRKLLGGGR